MNLRVILAFLVGIALPSALFAGSYTIYSDLLGPAEYSAETTRHFLQLHELGHIPEETLHDVAQQTFSDLPRPSGVDNSVSMEALAAFSRNAVPNTQPSDYQNIAHAGRWVLSQDPEGQSLWENRLAPVLEELVKLGPSHIQLAVPLPAGRYGQFDFYEGQTGTEHLRLNQVLYGAFRQGKATLEEIAAVFVHELAHGRCRFDPAQGCSEPEESEAYARQAEGIYLRALSSHNP
ncbi:MAG: hypothetical protein HY402_05945 [Elusimicrobia bacterium]|nr:hypothetical protein [Elusimicrobiota bacterium]